MHLIDKVKKKLDSLDVNSLLVSNQKNIRYLTGFKCSEQERECYFVIGPNKNIFIVPRMYQSEAKTLTDSDFEVVCQSKRKTLLHTAVLLLEGKVGFEEQDLKYIEYETLKKKLKTVKPVKNLIEDLRIIKDKGELQKIKRAVQIADKVFAETLAYLKPGQTELEVAQRIHGLAVKYGAENVSFPPIVAFGQNSARPHYKTSKVSIGKNGILLIDLGVKYKGYCSDLTRTIYIGEPYRKFKKRYKAVFNAQNSAIRAIKPRVKAKDIHNSVVRVFKGMGLEDKFLHSTGHGIGLDVHEFPSLYANSDTVLKEGMVLTIEPGVYIEEWGGVRIEDVVLVTKNGYEVLSKASKAIIQV